MKCATLQPSGRRKGRHFVAREYGREEVGEEGKAHVPPLLEVD